MSDSKMREEFEAYAAIQGMSVVMENSAMYQDRRTCDHWRTWQASRASVLNKELHWQAPQGSGLRRCVTDTTYRRFSPSIRARYTPVMVVQGVQP